MSLADIFSIPFLICVTVCILLIGCSSIFFYQKLTLQDHKISSMIEVISSMAEEIRQSNALQNKVFGGSSSCARVPNLIHVSDDDDTTEASSLESSNSESECDSDSDSESCSDESSSNESVEENQDTNKHIMVNLTMNDLNEIENEIIEIQELQENQRIRDMDLEDDDDVESDIEELKELEDIGQMGNQMGDLDHSRVEKNDKEDDSQQIKTIHLEEPTDEVSDFSIFKSINISSDENHLEKPDYKKMTIHKLREIAFQKGFADSSKLKKPEILKLLGVDL